MPTPSPCSITVDSSPPVRTTPCWQAARSTRDWQSCSFANRGSATLLVSIQQSHPIQSITVDLTKVVQRIARNFQHIAKQAEAYPGVVGGYAPGRSQGRLE